jgi:hypothetical protein
LLFEDGLSTYQDYIAADAITVSECGEFDGKSIARKILGKPDPDTLLEL